MFTVIMWFYCTDHLSIKHEVIRTFEGETREDIAIQVARFSRGLNDAGWIVLKTVKPKNLANMPER